MPESQGELTVSATVYRVFDSQDRLLYVGASVNWPQRLYAHWSATRFWELEAAKITLTHYPDREAALAAERHAICTENPVYNIAWRGAWPANMAGEMVPLLVPAAVEDL